MAASNFNFTTGPWGLPDAGALSYNGCTFSPSFYSSISGRVVPDAADRTTKLMEYTLKVDGYVTAQPGDSTVLAMFNLAQKLTAPSAELLYEGRGFNLHVNPPGQARFDTAFRDVAWGPVPKLTEFQPMGGGLSAKVQWQVVVRVVWQANPNQRTDPLLQFNCETSVTYGEDYHSTLSVRGTMEIPHNRTSQNDRTVPYTVDNVRGQLNDRIFAGIDLTRFRVTRRDYHVSRDKRTLEFDISATEKPYMDLPINCAQARGNYVVRPAKSGMGLANWLCTLRATYTVRKDMPRRFAWTSFLALMALRMRQATLGNQPSTATGTSVGNAPTGLLGFLFPTVNPQALQLAANVNQVYSQALSAANGGGNNRAWITDFNVDEGLYEDSKTVTFSATWRIVTTFSHIMAASGVWRKLPETTTTGQNLWATSMRDASRAVSWLPNTLDPNLDIIVDYGGG